MLVNEKTDTDGNTSQPTQAGADRRTVCLCVAAPERVSGHVDLGCILANKPVRRDSVQSQRPVVTRGVVPLLKSATLHSNHLTHALHEVEVEASSESNGHTKRGDVGRPPPVEARVEKVEPLEIESWQEPSVGLDGVTSVHIGLFMCVHVCVCVGGGVRQAHVSPVCVR